jgi:hypothetical protein
LPTCPPADLPISDATQIAIDAVDDAVTAHTSDHDNPHGVTAHQVDAYTQAETDSMVSGVTSAIAVVAGRTDTLENRVDAIDTDLGDLDTEQSSTALALSNHVADMGNPHGTTKAQLGLENVTNDAQLRASQLDTGTGLGTDDTKVPSQKAVKSYVDAGLDGKAAKTRAITAGAGLTGGGDLTADRSIALNAASVASLGKADSAVQPAGIAGLITDQHTHGNKPILDGIGALNLAPNGWAGGPGAIGRAVRAGVG